VKAGGVDVARAPIAALTVHARANQQMIDCTTAAHHELPLPGQQRGQLITRWRAADGAQHCRPHELYEKVVIGKGTRLALQPIDAGLIRQCTVRSRSRATTPSGVGSAMALGLVSASLFDSAARFERSPKHRNVRCRSIFF